jgi:uncharacterized protein YndB with AHSA1/START domain
VTLTRVYDTDAEDLWEACTSAERIPRWFLPVSGDLCVGGRFQLEGNAGGTIERCDPPKSFATTWEFGGGTSRLEVRLVPETEGRTRLQLEHTVPVDEHWEQFGPGSVGIGWELGLAGLHLHLSTGETVDPAEAAAWTATEDARRYMRQSGEGWYEAHVAGGERDETARAMADRPTAAYTIPPQDS